MQINLSQSIFLIYFIDFIKLPLMTEDNIFNDTNKSYMYHIIM